MGERSELGAVGDTALTKPRDAGEIVRQIPIEHFQRLGFPAARVDYGVTVDLLTAWRREIEEYVAASVEEQCPECAAAIRSRIR